MPEYCRPDRCPPNQCPPCLQQMTSAVFHPQHYDLHLINDFGKWQVQKMLAINTHSSRRRRRRNISGTSTPGLALSPSTKLRRRPIPLEKRQNSFKSSLTASLKALKSAAQSVSNVASNPPLVQPDDYLVRSVFDFRPSLTDDRRPPPSDEPPSAALRRYLNPRTVVPDDSPAQLHFWLDEKPTPAVLAEAKVKPKLKIKRKYQTQRLSSPPSANERAPFSSSTSSTSQLPALVPLATCIPGSIRTAHASSPPTWLEPDGTPSNKYRAAQTLWADPEHGLDEGQPRPREPRENRDFLRVFVCEMNMRKNGKLAEDAPGRAKLWLLPLDEGLKGEEREGRPRKREKAIGMERLRSWSVDEVEI